MKTTIRHVGLVCVLAIVLQTAGCASLGKKFVRKKKEPPHKPSVVYLQEGPYEKKFSHEYYYKTHFTMWKSWHSELIDQLGGNRKRVARSVQECVNHLEEMSKYLKDEKKTELEALVSEYRRFSGSLEQIGAAAGAGSRQVLRTDLERLGRRVDRRFYYAKVQSSLIPEKVEV